MSLYERVLAVLDATPETRGVIIADPSGEVLADRDPLPGDEGDCVLVILSETAEPQTAVVP